MHIFEEISRNPTKCAQDMININFFSTITKLIFNRSDSDSKIDLINHTLNILKNVFTSLIIHKDSDIVIKLINNIYQSKILDHIAKNIYGYQCEIDLFKELLTLLIENYEICNIYESEFKQNVFISSLRRLLLDSLFVRHIIFSMVRIDTLALNILQKNEYNISLDKSIAMSQLVITKKLPNYIKDWYKNSNKNTINLLALRVLPVLLSEMKRFKSPIPSDIDSRFINKLIKELVKTLKKCPNEIKTLYIVQDIIKLFHSTICPTLI